jgi:hypothetical protein
LHKKLQAIHKTAVRAARETDCVEFFMRPMAVLITRDGSLGWKLMSSRAMCVLRPLRTNGFFQFPFAAMYVKGGMKYLHGI